MEKLLGYEHASYDPYIFSIEKNNVEVRIKAPKDKVKEVRVSYGDPYDWEYVENDVNMQWTGGKYQNMDFIGTDGIYDWFSTKIFVKTKRLSYSFIIENIEKEIIILDESGVYKYNGVIDHVFNINNKFNYPYFFNGNIFSRPKWSEDMIWYQIFPDRFKRSGEYNSNLEWHYDKVKNSEKYGGNLDGVIESLDYLEELGVTGIYFTPMFKASTSHKYDTENYFEIDKDFGDIDIFKKLLKEAHKRGIRVMLDAVFNHMSFYNEIFQDVIKNKKKSKYFDWFYIEDTENFEDAINYNYAHHKKKYVYETFAYEPLMPKINTENEEVINYFKNVVKYWTELGIDAWRFDVANELSHNFVKEIRKEILSINRECYIIGEIWHDAQNWLKGDEFHAVMNYTYTNSMIEYFAKGTIDKLELKRRLHRHEMKYNSNSLKCAFNVVDTHDTERILYTCKEDKIRLMHLIVFLFSQKGSPCIYYGTEIGMTGDGIGLENNRRCMIWDDSLQDKNLFDFYKNIIKFRKENSIYLNDSLLEFEDSDILVYKTLNKNRSFRYILNNSSKDFYHISSGESCISINYSGNIIRPGGFLVEEII